MNKFYIGNFDNLKLNEKNFFQNKMNLLVRHHSKNSLEYRNFLKKKLNTILKIKKLNFFHFYLLEFLKKWT